MPQIGPGYEHFLKMVVSRMKILPGRKSLIAARFPQDFSNNTPFVVSGAVQYLVLIEITAFSKCSHSRVR